MHWIVPPSRRRTSRGIAVGIRRGSRDPQTAVVIDGAALALREHRRIQSGPADALALVRVELDPERDAKLRELVAAVRARHEGEGIPWGIASEGSSFDAAGELHLGDGCSGLTCATFVLVLFASVGAPLIDTVSWPAGDADPELLAARLERARVMARGDAAREAMLADEVLRSKLYLPEEVAAAASLTSPAAFDDVRPRRDELRAWLRAAR